MRLVPESREGVQSYRDTVGAAWEILIGRREDQVEKSGIPSKPHQPKQRSWVVQWGTIRNLDHKEELPVLKFVPQQKTDKKVSVIWVTHDGKNSAFENGKVAEEIRLIVKCGIYRDRS